MEKHCAGQGMVMLVLVRVSRPGGKDTTTDAAIEACTFLAAGREVESIQVSVEESKCQPVFRVMAVVLTCLLFGGPRYRDSLNSLSFDLACL
jgi:hypothetical protein